MNFAGMFHPGALLHVLSTPWNPALSVKASVLHVL